MDVSNIIDKTPCISFEVLTRIGNFERPKISLLLLLPPTCVFFVKSKVEVRKWKLRLAAECSSSFKVEKLQEQSSPERASGLFRRLDYTIAIGII